MCHLIFHIVVGTFFSANELLEHENENLITKNEKSEACFKDSKILWDLLESEP